MILAFNPLTVGVANATSEDIEQHAIYTRSLNTMVSTLMAWYGSLIEPTQNISFQPIDKAWQLYRKQYPKDISQIKILNTDLQKSKDNDASYTFEVETAISHKRGEQVALKYLNEQFNFQFTAEKPVITKISVKEQDNSQIDKTAQSSNSFDDLYFKSREFAYAWLAYLDGVQKDQTQIQTEGAKYSINIGSLKINKPLFEALQERKQFLTKGGHTLRALEITKMTDKPDHFQLDITMNWKGVNVKDKSVIAKVVQKIELQIQDDNAWKIISIDEQHLLPDLTPWQDLLC